MKSFNQWLNENKLQDFIRANNPDVSPDADPTKYMGRREKRRLAQQAGLPTMARYDRSRSLTSNFEKLRYHILTNGNHRTLAQLIQTLKNIKKKGLFPEFFPSKKDIFAGFSPEQLQMLKDMIKEGPETTDRQSEIGKKLYELKRRKAVARVPMKDRLRIAGNIDNHWSDWWGSNDWEEADFEPDSPRAKDLIAKVQRKFDFLGPDGKELSDEWLRKNGYWED